MRAGTLRFSAEIQRPVKTRAANGEQLVSWQSVAVRACSLQSVRGAESPTANIQIEVTHQWLVLLRWENVLSTITPEWQVLIDGRTFRITSIENPGNLNKRLRLTCVENV